MYGIHKSLALSTNFVANYFAQLKERLKLDIFEGRYIIFKGTKKNKWHFLLSGKFSRTDLHSGGL